MLDQVIGGTRHGYGSGGYGGGFEERKQFSSHVESDGGYYDRQSSYDQKLRLPGNHGRPPMNHMPAFHEDESYVEEHYENTHSHQGNNHYQQPSHLNYMPPPPGAQLHHHGKMGNGWQGRHEDAYHGGHGMQYQGGHGMQQHGAHGMHQHGSYQDRLMAPQIQSSHGYMSPNHGGGRKVVMQTTENWKVSNNGGGQHKAGWGSKGLDD